MDQINIQSLIQWLITGFVSVASVILAVKYGLVNLEKEFKKLEVDMKKEFSEIKLEIDRIRQKNETDSKDIAVLKFQADSFEKSINEIKETIKRIDKDWSYFTNSNTVK